MTSLDARDRSPEPPAELCPWWLRNIRRNLQAAAADNFRALVESRERGETAPKWRSQ